MQDRIHMKKNNNLGNIWNLIKSFFSTSISIYVHIQFKQFSHKLISVFFIPWYCVAEMNISDRKYNVHVMTIDWNGGGLISDISKYWKRLLKRIIHLSLSWKVIVLKELVQTSANIKITAITEINIFIYT